MYIKAIHIGNSPNPYSPVKYKNFNKDDKAKEEKKSRGQMSLDAANLFL